MKKISATASPATDEQHVMSETAEALKMILPLAEAYLRDAPNHPDQAKLETARAALSRAKGAA